MDSFIIICIALSFAFILEWFVRKLKIDNFDKRFVLVTGCDSGFGLELAKKLDKMGFNVFACCLTKSAVEKFNETSSSKLKAIEMDVTKDASIEKTMEIVKRRLPNGKGLWAVVNNAGILGGVGPTILHTRQEYENTLAVNLYGVIMVTKACLPLVLQEQGRIVNTSSIAGRVAFINSSYTISKYGVEAFSDVLRREIYRTGTKVQIIEPGAFKTPIWKPLQQMSVDKIASLPAEIKSQLPDDAADKMVAPYKILEETGSTQYNLVVDAYIHAITAKFPRKRYLVGTDAKYTYRLLWNLPEFISDYFFDKQGIYNV
ncbi:17-beta-hydroxysteroid dehydrogenase type 6-like [Ruditapes philippinarum]|uniref:17-beta-hydroxysteroid dehydrogenase type 6-like n=1 Tax=Ruditapes philippinarum TaxID=129788 RepID=UPI00295AE958|nr:17-beta-hydroxysteroid dehydrogenase type 6-like [Ruditapes philippinarum]